MTETQRNAKHVSRRDTTRRQYRPGLASAVKAGTGLLAGFGTIQLLGLIAPFIMLPVAARVEGIAGWATIALAQTLGIYGGIISALGWNSTGPILVAQADPITRSAVVAQSLMSRSLLLIPVALVISVLASFLLASEFLWLGVAVAVGQLLNSVSMRWYYVGTGNPGQLLLTDTLPRLAISALGAGLMLATSSIWYFPLALSLMSLLPMILAVSRTTSWKDVREAGRFRALRNVYGSQSGLMVSELIAGSYTSGSLTLAGFVLSVPDLARVGSADKLYRLAQNVVVVAGATLVPWIHRGGHASPRRMVASMWVHVIIGLTGGACLALIGPGLTAVLFGTAAEATASLMIGYGAAFAALSMRSACARHILITQGSRGRVFVIANAAGMISGVPLMALLGHDAGPVGFAWGLAAAEWISMLVLAVAILLAGRVRKRFINGPLNSAAPSSLDKQQGN